MKSIYNHRKTNPKHLQNTSIQSVRFKIIALRTTVESIPTPSRSEERFQEDSKKLPWHMMSSIQGATHGSTSSLYFIDFKNDQHTVVKYSTSPGLELAAYQLASCMGVRCPYVTDIGNSINRNRLSYSIKKTTAPPEPIAQKMTHDILFKDASFLIMERVFGRNLSEVDDKDKTRHIETLTTLNTTGSPSLTTKGIEYFHNLGQMISMSLLLNDEDRFKIDLDRFTGLTNMGNMMIDTYDHLWAIDITISNLYSFSQQTQIDKTVTCLKDYFTQLRNTEQTNYKSKLKDNVILKQPLFDEEIISKYETSDVESLIDLCLNVVIHGMLTCKDSFCDLVNTHQFDSIYADASTQFPKEQKGLNDLKNYINCLSKELTNIGK